MSKSGVRDEPSRGVAFGSDRGGSRRIRLGASATGRLSITVYVGPFG